MMELSYRRHRFPPVVIQHAVWLYLRFTLSERRFYLARDRWRAAAPAVPNDGARCRRRSANAGLLEMMTGKEPFTDPSCYAASRFQNGAAN
jgi:hypothetical protein